MAKLSHGADSWRSEGLLRKYKAQENFDDPVKYKSKKKTRKWCKGKVGTEHKLYRYYYYTRPWGQNKAKRTSWIRSRCEVCKKEFLTKDKSIPLRILVEDISEFSISPVQVKVNGKAIPIPGKWYYNERYYCDYCGKWHSE
jgi:hypothetical protein